jgi:multiple sugar transport system ATP-binding protein
MTLANKIVVLDGGAISQVGKPLELYHYPANQFVAGFLGSPKMNFLPVTVLAAEAQQVEVEVMGQTRLWLTVDGSNVTVGEPMTLGIRPEHLLDADSSQHQLYGEILVVEQLGNETQIHLQLPGYAEPLVYRHHDVAVVAEGVPLAIGIPAERCHLFHTDGRACRRLHPEPGV